MGLASAMSKSTSQHLRDITSLLLNESYMDYKETHELVDYVRRLRSQVKQLTETVEFMTDIEQMLEAPQFSKLISTVQWQDKQITTVYNDKVDHLAITVTLDPNRFTNIKSVSSENQKKYFKKILSQLYIDNEFNNIYGSFELQQNGNVHLHAITRMYNTPHNRRSLEDAFKRYVTHNPKNRYAVEVKPCTDISGWLIYINKPDPIKEFFQINI